MCHSIWALVFKWSRVSSNLQRVTRVSVLCKLLKMVAKKSLQNVNKMLWYQLEKSLRMYSFRWTINIAFLSNCNHSCKITLFKTKNSICGDCFLFIFHCFRKIWWWHFKLWLRKQEGNIVVCVFFGKKSQKGYEIKVTCNYILQCHYPKILKIDILKFFKLVTQFYEISQILISHSILWSFQKFQLN